MAAREIYDITVKLLHETRSAILVTEDDETKIWLPKSQVEYEAQPDGTCIVTAPVWLLKEKGLL